MARSKRLDSPPMRTNNGEWQILKPWLEARIEQLRDELETPGVDPEHLRGQIAELRYLIRKVEPDAPEGAGGGYFPPQRAPQQPS